MTPRLLAVAAAVAVVLPCGAASAPGTARSVRPDHHHHHDPTSAATVAAGVAPAANASVVVANLSFSPKTVGVALGETVTWIFPEPMTHTSTSDQGFWDSGNRANDATYARAFTSAGTFAYHCTVHFSMRGVVKVPLTVTGSPADGWKLRWSTTKAGTGRSFDVQTRRGSGKWKFFRENTKRAKGKFDPDQSGRYKVRARSSKGSADSGWSPVRTVRVS